MQQLRLVLIINQLDISIDMQLLTSFEVTYYSLDKVILNYKPNILSELFLSIKESINHACERCMHEGKAQASAKYRDMCHEEGGKSHDENVVPPCMETCHY